MCLLVTLFWNFCLEAISKTEEWHGCLQSDIWLKPATKRWMWWLCVSFHLKEYIPIRMALERSFVTILYKSNLCQMLLLELITQSESVLEILFIVLFPHRNVLVTSTFINSSDKKNLWSSLTVCDHISMFCTLTERENHWKNSTAALNIK